MFFFMTMKKCEKKPSASTIPLVGFSIAQIIPAKTEEVTFDLQV